MIIYGDSWCFSFEKGDQVSKKFLRWGDDTDKFPKRTSDILCGMSLSELMGCRCGGKRRVNNAEILQQIKEYPCIILQSDPLRDTFIDWNSKKKPNRLTFDEEFIPDGEFDLMDVCKNRLDLFYSKLEGSDIILFSGTSKVDVELARKYNLKYIEQSATEIIVGKFDDTPLFDYHYTIFNDQYLKKTFPNYKSKKSILDKVGNKNLIWEEHPDLFSHRHATEKGNIIISKYLNKHVDKEF